MCSIYDDPADILAAREDDEEIDTRPACLSEEPDEGSWVTRPKQSSDNYQFD